MFTTGYDIRSNIKGATSSGLQDFVGLQPKYGAPALNIKSASKPVTMPQKTNSTPRLASMPQQSDSNINNIDLSNIPVNTNGLGLLAGGTAGMPQQQKILGETTLPGGQVIGKDKTLENAARTREQYASFGSKYDINKQQEEANTQKIEENTKYNPLKKTVEQIKARIPADLLVGMSDKQILKKAYTEMPNFKKKLDEKLANTPYQLSEDKDGYGFILKSGDEIKKMKKSGLLNDKYKASVEQDSIRDEIKINNKGIQENMDRMVEKMSYNPATQYTKGVTNSDKINLIKDQAEYMGYFLLNAPSQLWNNITDIIPGTAELTKSLIKDPVGVAKGTVNLIDSLSKDTLKISDIISKNPIDAIFMAEGIYQTPNITKSLSKLPKQTRELLEKGASVIPDIKKGGITALDDFVNTWKQSKLDGKALNIERTIDKQISTVKPEDFYRGPTDVKITPDISKKIQKSIKPTVIEKKGSNILNKFEKDVVKGIDTVISYGDDIKYPDELGELTKVKTPETLRELSIGITQAKERVFNEYNMLSKKAGGMGAKVNIKTATSELIKLRERLVQMPGQKGAVKYIDEAIKDLQSKGLLDIDIAQDTVKYYNSRLDSFYKNPTYNDIDKATIDALINNNIRNSMEEIIETSLGGDEYGALRDKYRALKSIEREVNKRAIVSERGNTKGLIDFADIVSADQAIRGIIGMIGGDVLGGVKNLGGGAIINYVKNRIKTLNSPDKNLRDLIEIIKRDRRKIFIPKDKLHDTNNMSNNLNNTINKGVKGNKKTGGGLVENAKLTLGVSKQDNVVGLKPNKDISIGATKDKVGKPVEKITLSTKTVEKALPIKEQTIDTSYRSAHQIDTTNSNPITSIDSNKIDIFVNEFKKQYGYPALKSKEINKLKQIMSNPEQEITIYRASPKNELNNGDWVTIDKDYANDIKKQNGGKVYSYKVKAKELLYPNTVEGFNELPSLNKRGAFQYKKQPNPLQSKVSNPVVTMKDPLLAEARKYKSVDDFIQSQGYKLYHGGPDKILEFDLGKAGVNTQPSTKAIFLTNKESFAKEFAKHSALEKETFKRTGKKDFIDYTMDNAPVGEVTNVFIKKGLKIFDYNIPEDISKLGLDKTSINKFKNKKRGFTELEQYGNKIKDLGYDGFIVNEKGASNVAIFDPKNIKTESQLKQIREEANKTKGLPIKKGLEANTIKPVDKILHIDSMIDRVGYNVKGDIIEINAYKGIRGFDIVDTPGVGVNNSFLSNNIDRAKSYHYLDGDVINVKLKFKKNEVKIIDSNGMKWYDKVDDNGNVVKGVDKNSKNNYINYNTIKAEKEGYKVIIFRDISDMGPKMKSNYNMGGDDIILLNNK